MEEDLSLMNVYKLKLSLHKSLHYLSILVPFKSILIHIFIYKTECQS